MVYISRKEHFNAAHRLFNPEWSDEKNNEVFGVCANKNGHGHNFELTVTVKGEPQADTGWVMNMKELGQIIKEHVTDKLDHRHMNYDVDFLQGKIPSCEIVVIEIWKILDAQLKALEGVSAELHCVRLRETPKNVVEYYG